jgi:hypothetical protein
VVIPNGGNALIHLFHTIVVLSRQDDYFVSTEPAKDASPANGSSEHTVVDSQNHFICSTHRFTAAVAGPSIDYS